jgi:hypothetical protein
MALAPFAAGGEPVMANYNPVLESPLFLGGLLAFAAGVALLVLRTLANAPRLGLAFDGRGALRFGLNVAAVATAVALLAFAGSGLQVPRGLAGKAYYEILFWGGGHALQFTWTLLMLVAWLWLAAACGARLPLSPRVALLMFALALAAVFVTPYAYLAHDVTSVEHRELLTWAMRLGGGVAILPVALAAVAGLHVAPPLVAEARPWRAALLSSVLLIGAGGLIGLLITCNNVRIPAHYHGCIVGVTLALMGVVYTLLPALGYAAPQGRLAVAQPWVYAAGQLMHIVGLVWSGGYGVQRKVAGAEQVLRTPGEIAGMGLMGLGGAVAIVGGLLFLLVVLRAMRRARVPHGAQRAGGCWRACRRCCAGSSCGWRACSMRPSATATTRCTTWGRSASSCSGWWARAGCTSMPSSPPAWTRPTPRWRRSRIASGSPAASCAACTATPPTPWRSRWCCTCCGTSPSTGCTATAGSPGSPGWC